MTLRSLTCFSLVAALLFAGLPAWEHAHAGGNRTHDHGHEHHGSGEPHAHFHVTLFGIEFTLPVESDGQDESDDNDDSSAGKSTYLVSAPASPDAAQSSLPLSPCLVLFDTAQVLQSLPTFHSKTAVAAPLCDAARHERSGVLLV